MTAAVNCASRPQREGNGGARRSIAPLLFAVLLAATPAIAQKRNAASIIPGGNAKAPINIDAGRLDFFDKESKLVYSGGVLARQGEATLKAKTLTIFMVKDVVKNSQSSSGNSGDQVRRMEAAGPVTITSKDQVGTGNRGIYDKEANKVYLIGNPVLTQGSNIVRGGPGAQLIYDLNTGRARITGGRVQSIIVPKGENEGTKKRR
ncbi:MAG: LptA/OstA family protein [Beijerinckiaceae bacterium]